MNLRTEVEHIQSRQDFATFLCRLVSDFQKNPEAWENNTIDLYLEALAAWVEDMDGYYQNAGEQPPDQIDLEEPRRDHAGGKVLQVDQITPAQPDLVQCGADIPGKGHVFQVERCSVWPFPGMSTT